MTVEFRTIDRKAGVEFKSANKADFFPDDLILEVISLLSPDEKTKYDEVDSHYQGGLTLHYGVFVDNVLVGVHHGRQFERGVYHMGFSAILKKFQRQGLYTQLLHYVIAEVGKLGFQAITSRHNASNNPVIIPKLKAGFLIGGFEINDAVGLQVRLVYYFNEARRDMHHFRTGRSPAPTEAANLMPPLKK